MADEMILLKEGKNKKVFSVPGRDDFVLIEFKDSIAAFNNQKKAEFPGKAHICREITSITFKYLHSMGIDNHFIESVGEKSFKAMRLKLIPLEVVIRNIVAGNLSQKLQLPVGKPIRRPIVEFYLKDDSLGDPFLNDDQIYMLELLNHQELLLIKEKAQQVNAHLQNLFREIGIILVDFKIEFGRNLDGLIYLADEVTPDSCRLWDESSKEPLDKDRFRKDMGQIFESYSQILQRLRNRTKPE